MLNITLKLFCSPSVKKDKDEVKFYSLATMRTSVSPFYNQQGLVLFALLSGCDYDNVS
jgi:hypothetical protein